MDIVSLADLKQAAKQKIPSDLWDFIEGAAFDEVTKQRNEEKYQTCQKTSKSKRF